jgi:hypothetical protein
MVNTQIRKRVRVVVDLGNSLLKAMLEGRFDTVKVIPHSVKFLTKAEFDSVYERMENGAGRGTESTTSMFKYFKRDKTTGQDVEFYCVVGQHAETNGADARRAGGPKYDSDYYPALAIAMLLHLLPKGHEDIQIVAAFPPGDIHFTSTLRASLGGRHDVTLADGRKISYAVRAVSVFDEPVGGMWNFMLSNDGIHYNANVPSGAGLCIDIGGRISSIVPFDSTGWVDYQRAKSVDMGIQDVMMRVSKSLLATTANRKFFRQHRGDLPFDGQMRDCLRTGLYEVGGYEIDALTAVADATSVLRNEIKQVYEYLGGARPYKYILVSGGGGGLMFTQLVEHVLNFNPTRVYPAHTDMDQMHIANLLGGDKALAAADVADKPVKPAKKGAR